MQIGTLTTGVGVVTTINTTWVPEYIFYVAATQLTGLKVTVQGDGVITDLDSAGLSALGRIRDISAVTNGWLIPLADGIVTGKNVTFTFTNSAAQTPAIYGIVRRKGRVYVQCLQQQALANSGLDIMDFGYAAFPNAGATDVFNVTFADGTVNQFNRAELQAMLTLTEDVQNSSSDYSFDNLAQSIKKVNFIPVASQVFYISRFAPIGNLSNVVTQ